MKKTIYYLLLCTSLVACSKTPPQCNQVNFFVNGSHVQYFTVIRREPLLYITEDIHENGFRLWIYAPSAETIEQRTHTMLKALEDELNVTQAPEGSISMSYLPKLNHSFFVKPGDINFFPEGDSHMLISEIYDETFSDNDISYLIERNNIYKNIRTGPEQKRALENLATDLGYTQETLPKSSPFPKIKFFEKDEWTCHK
jgi:hypothetical protein